MKTDGMTKSNGQILSLGGGVQSTALLLMSLHGEIDYPCSAAVFADTGWERQVTYDNVAWLTEYAKGFNVDVHTVKFGNLREDCLTQKFVHIPVYLKKNGKHAITKRQCTKHYKIVPTNKLVRKLTRPTVKKPTYLWLGFSTDEAHRMKTDRYKTLLHRFPLIEKRLTRSACYEWLRKNGFDTPAKSACLGCPYNHDTSWRSLTQEELNDAIEFENDMQARYKKTGLISEPYLHASCTPIADKPFSKSEGQLEFDTESEVCEGNCFT